MHNVEEYLQECVDSLLAQTFDDFEVILVDDGSTDGSPKIAKRFARRDPRFRYIRTDNQGLGAARNVGVRMATSEFLAFLDSDDALPGDSYEYMIRTLEETGSDFVVGSMQRWSSTHSTEPPWIRRIHRERRLKVALDDFPEIMHNVFAWNKVFRRSFWDESGLVFPEGVRYEDQVTVTEAYLKAKRFDIIRRSVYLWRIREDGSSITQRRHELDDLRDRIATKRLTTEVVNRFGSDLSKEEWYRQGLPGDLPFYFREVPTCSSAYWDLLSDGVREMFEGLPPIEESRLPVGQRVVGWLVAHDRRAEASEVVAYLAERSGPAVERRGDHMVALLPFVDDRGLAPPELFHLQDHELEWDARLLEVDWSGSTLVLSGFALVRGVPTQWSEQSPEVWLESADAERADCAVEIRACPEATAWVSRSEQNYDGTGFDARIDVTRLGSPGTWTVKLSRTAGPVRRAGGFRTSAVNGGGELVGLSLGEISAELSFTSRAGLLVEIAG